MSTEFETSISLDAVVMPDGDKEGKLTISHKNGAVTFYLDGKELFGAGWDGWFATFLEAALEMWPNTR